MRGRPRIQNTGAPEVRSLPQNRYKVSDIIIFSILFFFFRAHIKIQIFKLVVNVLDAAALILITGTAVAFLCFRRGA